MKTLILTSNKSAATHSQKFLRQIEYLKKYKQLSFSILEDATLSELDQVICSQNYDCIYPTSVFQYVENTDVIEKFNQDMYKLLNYRNQNYIGSDILTHLLLNDKALSNKKSKIGLPNLVITKKSWQANRKFNEKIISDFVKFPVIIKPNTLAASLGITKDSIVSDMNDVFFKVKSLFLEFPQLNEVLIERFLGNSIEYAVSVTGNKNKKIVNITKLNSKTNNKEIFSFENKNAQDLDRSINYCIETDQKKASLIRSEALRLSEVFNIRDTCRFDFLMDENNQLYLIDANSMPFLGNNYFFEYTSQGIVKEEQVFGLLLFTFMNRVGCQLDDDIFNDYPYELLHKIID